MPVPISPHGYKTRMVANTKYPSPLQAPKEHKLAQILRLRSQRDKY